MMRGRYLSRLPTATRPSANAAAPFTSSISLSNVERSIFSSSVFADKFVNRPISPMQRSVYTASMPVTRGSFVNRARVVSSVVSDPAAKHAAATHLAKLCATN